MKITTLRERAPLRSVKLELTRAEAITIAAALSTTGGEDLRGGLDHLRDMYDVERVPGADHWQLVHDVYDALVGEL